MRSVRFRIVALFVLVAAAFAVCTTAWHMSEQENLLHLVDASRKERLRVYSSVLDTRLKQLDTTILDYTLWDDFADYISTRDQKFISEQVNTSTNTMHTSALWVFDSDGKLIHSYSVADTADLFGKSMSPSFVKDKFTSRQNVSRFFIKHEDHYDEIVGTSIHGSDDLERSGKVYGYFIVSRPWRVSDLASLGELANAEVSFKEYAANSDKSKTSAQQKLIPTSESKPLLGPSGEPVAFVHFSAPNKLAWEMRSSLSRATSIILLFAGTMTGLVFLCILLWVGRPLKSILVGLESDDPERLKRMIEKDDEFARIALLIRAFFDQRDSIARHNVDLENRVVQRTEALQNAYDSTIEGWAKALDLRDHETEGHSRRVTEFSCYIGEQMGLTEDQLIHLRRGALLHDIGKVGIPDSILLKEGPLTQEERKIMETHPVLAYNMLKDIPFIEEALPVALYHHERWDGKGYPDRLKGDSIPLLARIFALADVWDALRSDRPYRKAWNEAKVREHIKSLSGTHFDPRVVEVYLATSPDQLAEIRRGSLPPEEEAA
ncbi:MAG: HD domain-containing protein [Fimbriimonadaceae bacterium]|nr:HD domain-containing protein [Fimbriimonadaceae bacterium]